MLTVLSERDKPDFIRHVTELQKNRAWLSPDPRSDKRFSKGAPLGSSLGLARIAVNHEVLPPGRRTSLPQAHSHDEEFIFILTGKPDLWIDGRIYPLVPGNVVAFPAGTGIAHTVINNTEEDVRILVVGDADQSEDRCLYPLNPELKFVDDIPWWEDAPRRPLGPHAGRPNCRE